jgi:hypothetical protein
VGVLFDIAIEHKGRVAKVFQAGQKNEMGNRLHTMRRAESPKDALDDVTFPLLTEHRIYPKENVVYTGVLQIFHMKNRLRYGEHVSISFDKILPK